MPDHASLDQRIAENMHELGPTEQRVAHFFRSNREEVLVSSAAELASKVGTSDATVIRTAKALGYSGMDGLRRELANQLRHDLSPASRMARTLNQVGGKLDSAFELTLRTHIESLERLRRDINPVLFETVVGRVVAAPRVFIFGIGPSSTMADYFAIQLGRFGIDGRSLTDTGLLLADGLHRLRKGDLLFILAYSRVYREIAAILERAEVLALETVLITDTLGSTLGRTVGYVLPVARGRAEMLSLHSATLGLIEAVLVGVATRRPTETVASLTTLNKLRTKTAAKLMDLPAMSNTRRHRKKR
jgi:DNA-binding MurR/RpiR family transcriptional regulator